MIIVIKYSVDVFFFNLFFNCLVHKMSKVTSSMLFCPTYSPKPKHIKLKMIEKQTNQQIIKCDKLKPENLYQKIT